MITTAETITTPTQAGWLEGFTDRPITSADYELLALPTGSSPALYALLWPGLSQGSVEAMVNRLLRASDYGSVVPAKPDHRACDPQKLLDLMAAQQDAIRGLTNKIGDCYQFSVIGRPSDPAPLQSIAPHDHLRQRQAVRHHQQTEATAFRDAIETLAIQAPCPIKAVSAITPCGMERLAINVLAHRQHFSDLLDYWADALRQTTIPALSKAQLIAPLPPFAFATL